MKRIIWDVPRWSLYLHRNARSLPRADQTDAVVRKLEDELFERLFAGDIEPLADVERDSTHADWAQRIHDTIHQLPAFERLAQECRGQADVSAMAVETLAEELRPDRPEDELRRSARSACKKATSAIEEVREAREGLEHVTFGHLPGSQPGMNSAHAQGEGIRGLAAQLRDDHRLRRVALLAGRFKRIAAAKRRQRVRHGADEIADVEQGGDLGRLLPVELAKLTRPHLRLLALRDLLERQLIQYRLEGSETLGKGPLVVALDKSGSMDGAADRWATAVALALLEHAQRERRHFALLGFDAGIKYEAVVPPGGRLPSDGLFVPCNGGTDIGGALSRGLDIVEQHPGALRKADIVLITDGECDPESAATIRSRARDLGVTILGFGIGVQEHALAPWCDSVETHVNLSNLQDSTADQLFGG